MNDDGSMARLPELKEIAKKFDLKLISIKDLIEYRLKTDSLIEEVVRVDMPTKYGHFKLVAFRDKNTNAEHLALIKGTWEKDEPAPRAGTLQLFHRRYPRIFPLRLR